MLRVLFLLKSITVKNGYLLCDKILPIHLAFSKATHLDKQFFYSCYLLLFRGRGNVGWLEFQRLFKTNLGCCLILRAQSLREKPVCKSANRMVEIRNCKEFRNLINRLKYFLLLKGQCSRFFGGSHLVLYIIILIYKIFYCSL